MSQVIRRCLVVLAVWAALGISFVSSTDVRASLWASGVATALPGTWVTRLQPTGSMEPTLTSRDWLVYQRVPFSRIRAGDVISFHCPLDGVPVTHRVVRVLDGGRFLTKGDNNPEVDPWTVEARHYRGVLVSVHPGS